MMSAWSSGSILSQVFRVLHLFESTRRSARGGPIQIFAILTGDNEGGFLCHSKGT